MAIKAKERSICIRLSEAAYEALQELLTEDEEETISSVVRKALRYYRARKLYEKLK